MYAALKAFTKHPFLLAASFLIAVAAVTVLVFSGNEAKRRAVNPAHAAQNSGIDIARAARALTPLPVRPVSAELKRRSRRAAQTASELRELSWLNTMAGDEPGLTELTGWEYGTHTRELAEVLGGSDLRNVGRLGAAGGVLPDGIDLSALAASFTAFSADATYSPFAKRVLLRTKQRQGESLLVHESVHALQDQHFDLLRLLVNRPFSFDRTEAAFAVIEGDAVGIQRRAEHGAAWARQPLDRVIKFEDARFDEYRQGVGSLFAPLLSETFIFRYRDGLRFVETVRRREGQEGVNKLFRQPPLSSEQILHPDKYFAKEEPLETSIQVQPLADKGWNFVTGSPFGEIGVRGVLMDAVSTKEAARAAAGWGGDQAYLFERPNNGGTLFVWKSKWDTTEDANEFLAAYDELQKKYGSVVVASDDEKLWRDANNKFVLVMRTADDEVIVLRGVEADVRRAVSLIA